MRVALAQITSGPEIAQNLELVADRLRAGAEQGAELVVLPEATMRAFGTRLDQVAEPLDGPFATRVRELAVDAGVHAVVGMFTPGHGVAPSGRPRVRNTLLVTGAEVHRGYDKVHLFDAFGFTESDTVDAGARPVTITLGGVTFGLATCYDVRFPALFTRLAADGADAVVVCASWASGPGKVEQWELLTRARALDCTSYVLACGQADPAATGVDARPGAPTGVGHSGVVGPDGVDLARAGAGAELLVAELDAVHVRDVRARLPVLRNARL